MGLHVALQGHHGVLEGQGVLQGVGRGGLEAVAEGSSVVGELQQGAVVGAGARQGSGHGEGENLQRTN